MKQMVCRDCDEIFVGNKKTWYSKCPVCGSSNIYKYNPNYVRKTTFWDFMMSEESPETIRERNSSAIALALIIVLLILLIGAQRSGMLDYLKMLFENAGVG